MVGAGMTRFAKQPERTFKQLAADAAAVTLDDAGRDAPPPDACYFANAAAGSITGQEMLAGEFALFPQRVGGIPIYNVENACASASTAFHLAWQAVAAGFSDRALAIGVEKMTHPDKARSFAAIAGAVDVDTVPPDPPADRSYLMDLYAQSAIDYMEASGATREDLARVVIKNQRHGALNPYAQYGGELTVDDVLSGREIVWPFTLTMCAPISDGAAGALLVGEDALNGRDGAIEVLASTLRSATPWDEAAPKVTAKISR